MTRSERLAWFIGETARPLAIMVSSFAASIASVIVATKVENGNDGAILIAAIFGGAGVFYGFKAVETWKGKQAETEVEVAKVEAKK